MADNANKIVKKNWVSRFHVLGKAKVGDYTFKIDEQSSRSSWVYNSMNLGIDCGEKYGTCYVNMMGGYSPERTNTIYVHGKDENGRDDFQKRIEVDWDDRFNESILEEIGDQCFIRVGIEKTVQGNTFTKRFLSAYDAIAYVKEHLTDDMVITVGGDIKYNMYNDNVSMNKEIKSIFISNVDDPSKFHATFTQSVLIDKDSASLKDIDKNTGIMTVDAIVLDYIKEYNGHEIKGQWPYHKQMEWQFDLSKPESCKKIYNKLFKVKKGYTQITFEGDFVSGGGTTVIDYDADVPDDIKELVDMGVYTKKEAIESCTTSTRRENHMFLRKPSIFVTGDEENKMSTVQVFPEQYDEDDLDMSWAMAVNDDDSEDDELPFGSSESVEDGNTGDIDDLSWLDSM